MRPLGVRGRHDRHREFRTRETFIPLKNWDICCPARLLFPSWRSFGDRAWPYAVYDGQGLRTLPIARRCKRSIRSHGICAPTPPERAAGTLIHAIAWISLHKSHFGLLSHPIHAIGQSPPVEQLCVGAVRDRAFSQKATPFDAARTGRPRRLRDRFSLRRRTREGDPAPRQARVASWCSWTRTLRKAA